MNLNHPRSLLSFLYAQRVVGFEPPTSIGLDDEARAAFLELLRESEGYLEFGSGGSTIEAGRQCVRTLSVEADGFFAAAVRKALADGARVEILHVEIGLTREWSRPVFTSPTTARVERWGRYYRRPFERLEDLGWFPDFVLIDGRFRRACALETARRAAEANRELKLLFDDYTYEDRGYSAVEAWLGRPDRIGRAALFDVGKSKLLRIPTDADVSAAAGDYA